MTQIQLRRGAAATWTSVNPVLALGEVGFETDTRKLKVGDGSTQWTGLSYTIDTSTLATLAGAETVSNKTLTAVTVSSGTVSGTRVNPRISTTASSATPSINVDTTDQFNITALAVAITSMTSGLTGTPVDGQKLLIRIKDNGTARAITWGAGFVASGATPLPTTTVLNKTHLIGFIYDSAAAKWVCVAADSIGY